MRPFHKSDEQRYISLLRLYHFRRSSGRFWWWREAGFNSFTWWIHGTTTLSLQSQWGRFRKFPLLMCLKSNLYVNKHESPSSVPWPLHPLAESVCPSPQGAGNNWLRVIPRTRFGAFARGAKVVLFTRHSGAHLRIIDGGSGYLCEMEPVAHFGLGEWGGVEAGLGMQSGVWPQVSFAPAICLLVQYR